MAKKQYPKERYDAQPTPTEVIQFPLDALVGRVCLEFNELEEDLFGILWFLTGADRFGAATVWSMHMWSSRLQLIGKLLVMRGYDDDSSVTEYWRRLSSALGEVGAQRNAVAHGQQALHQDLTGQQRYLLGGGFLSFDPRLTKRAAELTENDLREFVLDIRVARQAVSHFANAIMEQNADEARFLSHPIRRRPPKGQRPS